MLAVLGAPRRHRRRHRDVFVNVVGGVRVDEPGADLAVALAVASAARGAAGRRRAPLACFGEVGLTGELRTVAHPDRRAQEAAKFGLRTVVSPAQAPTAARRPAMRLVKRPAGATRGLTAALTSLSSV